MVVDGLATAAVVVAAAGAVDVVDVLAPAAGAEVVVEEDEGEEVEVDDAAPFTKVEVAASRRVYPR